VGLKIYSEWQKGPWSLPGPVGPRATAERVDGKPQIPAPPAVAGTDVIIAKNLFDPERGASQTKATEADTRAAQRIRGMILLGTAILGSNRYAIVQDGDTGARPPAVGQATQGPRRIKVGDSIEGFSLAEVREKAVVFTRGATRVELAVDYFRKAPVTAVAPPAQPGQPSPPGVPRSAAQPAPGSVPGQVAPAPAPGQPTPRVAPNLPRRPRLPAPPADQ
jgi:hypothetical protein